MNNRNPSRSDLGRFIREYKLPFGAMRGRIIVGGILYIIYSVLFFTKSPLADQGVKAIFALIVVFIFVPLILYVSYRGDSVRVYENGIESCRGVFKPTRFLWRTTVGYRYAFMIDYVFLIEQGTKREFILHQSIFSSSTFLSEVERFTSHKWVKVGL